MQRCTQEGTVVGFLHWENFQAIDPRDYVYGLLGLTDCGITANYSRDISSVPPGATRFSECLGAR
jgi:hypothetical protein